MVSLSLYVISNQFATLTDFQVAANFCFLCVKRKISKCARVFFVQYTSGVSTNDSVFTFCPLTVRFYNWTLGSRGRLSEVGPLWNRNHKLQINSLNLRSFPMLSKSKSYVIEIIKYRKVPKIRKETCLYRKFIGGILPLHLLNGQRETKFSYSIRESFFELNTYRDGVKLSFSREKAL